MTVVNMVLLEYLINYLTILKHATLACPSHPQLCEMSHGLQACHDVVPPDWLQPVIRHLCNQFIHDRARPEEIVVGLKTVREICMRMPLVMSEELLLVRTINSSHDHVVCNMPLQLSNGVVLLPY